MPRGAFPDDAPVVPTGSRLSSLAGAGTAEFAFPVGESPLAARRFASSAFFRASSTRLTGLSGTD